MTLDSNNSKTITPLMKQYLSVKAKYPDTILLFRVGDFYETFGQDAVTTSEILGIILTRKANGSSAYTEMAGFPFHAIDTYLPRLVRAGQKVAVCEQLEDPKSVKGLVRRGITELITPGVALSDQVLEHRENNFLACVYFSKPCLGLALLDFSTGEFFVAQGDKSLIEHWLTAFSPKEVLIERYSKTSFLEQFGTQYYLSYMDDWAFVSDNAYSKLNKHFGTQSLKGFGLDYGHSGIVAAGAIFQYMELTQHHKLSHIAKITELKETGYAGLDKYSIHNLELLSTHAQGGVPLIAVMDKTKSVMGARLLKRWMVMPLFDVAKITERQSIVQYLLDNESVRTGLIEQFSQIGDLERLSAKLSTEKISPREMNQLKNTLLCVQKIKEIGQHKVGSPIETDVNNLDSCEELCSKIVSTLCEDAPAVMGKGQVITSGVNEELDKLRGLLHSGKDYLLEYQKREIDRTGISTLKVSYNNVFGYYIEVRNSNKDKVPEDWIRKQTLVNAERYITEELKTYESQILGAEDKIQNLETQLYSQLVNYSLQYLYRMQNSAKTIAKLDILSSFAETAILRNYCKPQISDDNIIDIKQGRHPVIEMQLSHENPYIPNDVYLDTTSQQIMIITGPNMSGKSALLRQTAIIVLMAQMGSYVPADSAHIGIVDKIFTRVGASDNISQGESTFMVEMIESAGILNNVTNRSLVLLDEIGRGTSTYDGISIAWAMVEFLHEHPNAKAKTLFATHYHELNEMENSFSRVKNYNVSIKESGNKIIFLRQLVAGGSEHSFGIHVARIAGMPKSVIKRAEEILKQLEAGRDKQSYTPQKQIKGIAEQREGIQLSFYQLDDPVLSQIREELVKLDINTLTPIEALNRLNTIKSLVGGNRK